MKTTYKVSTYMGDLGTWECKIECDPDYKLPPGVQPWGDKYETLFDLIKVSLELWYEVEKWNRAKIIDTYIRLIARVLLYRSLAWNADRENFKNEEGFGYNLDGTFGVKLLRAGNDIELYINDFMLERLS